jgi:hypothetical protein
MEKKLIKFDEAAYNRFLAGLNKAKTTAKAR